VPEQAGIEFLSAEWFAAMALALERVEPAGGEAVVLGQIVTGVPSAAGGDVCYAISLGGNGPGSVTVGSLDSADVVLVTAYADARAMATGAASAASLIAAGRVKIRGDAARLVAAAALVEAAGAAMGDVHRIVT
jgi:hypothetical protein